MVMHTNNQVTSSKVKSKDPYDVGCLLRYHPLAPVMTNINEQLSLVERRGDFRLHGVLGSETLDSRRWIDPPHKALANLPVLPFIDVKPVEAFTLRYGVLRFDTPHRAFGREVMLLSDESQVPGFDSTHETEFDARERHAPGLIDAVKFVPGAEFFVDSEEMQMAQHTLREAWDENPAALKRIQDDAVGDMELVPVHGPGRGMRRGGFELRAKNLWNFVCVLFLHDRALGRLGKCLNPGCPAKYFVKRRRSQKFCELGPCTGYAQRKYALKWWKEVGQPRRAEESLRRSNSKERKRRRR